MFKCNRILNSKPHTPTPICLVLLKELNIPECLLKHTKFDSKLTRMHTKHTHTIHALCRPRLINVFIIFALKTSQWMCVCVGVCVCLFVWVLFELMWLFTEMNFSWHFLHRQPCPYLFVFSLSLSLSHTVCIWNVFYADQMCVSVCVCECVCVLVGSHDEYLMNLI